MFSKKFFSNRFKCLRIAHYLSSAQCAYFLGFKSTGSIADIESGKKTPLVESLVDAGHFFGVSIDWLLGETNTPYTQENIVAVEDYVWATITANMHEVPKLAEEFDDFIIPNCYKRMNERNQYPLPVRANITFIASVLFIMETSAGKKGEDDIYRKKIEKTFSSRLEGLLKGLLLQQIKAPVFDLTKQPIEIRDFNIWKI